MVLASRYHGITLNYPEAWQWFDLLKQIAMLQVWSFTSTLESIAAGNVSFISAAAGGPPFSLCNFSPSANEIAASSRRSPLEQHPYGLQHNC